MMLTHETPEVGTRRAFLHEHLYGFDPVDPRLKVGYLNDPEVSDILDRLGRAQSLGYEGLVLRQGDRWIKVKPKMTHDVANSGFSEGRGKHAGRLGIIYTPLAMSVGLLQAAGIDLRVSRRRAGHFSVVPRAAACGPKGRRHQSITGGIVGEPLDAITCFLRKLSCLPFRKRGTLRKGFSCFSAR
jgi:hypothetical protein